MRTQVMGILNVTPDSFSDGGQFSDVDQAVQRGLQMVEHGADWVDVGGESTRPGALPVSPEEELARVLPVIKRLTSRGVPVSIDTSKAAVARASLEAGATFVNDVSAMRDPAMAEVVAKAEVPICLMHMQGTPLTMQIAPTYSDVVSEVSDFLAAQADRAIACGIDRSKIVLDPGIGFGKSIEHNLALLRNLTKLVSLGYPVLVGVSRKGFLGRVLCAGEPLPLDERLEGTLACEVLAVVAGVQIIRTHDVRASVRAIRMTEAIVRPS